MEKSRQQKRQEMRKGKKQGNDLWIYAVIAVVLVAIIGVCVYFAADWDKNEEIPNNQEVQETPEFDKEPQVEGEHDQVVFTMENGESFTVELYHEYAPQTVENFTRLVKEGFYDGLTFHRVVEGFMAQGGDPEGNGSGGSAQNILGEFYSNGFIKNTLSHQRGIISMARKDDPNSASSQFFICYDDASFLDGDYAAFGKVIEGMETVDNFLNVERELNEIGEEAAPVTPIVIEKAVIK